MSATEVANAFVMKFYSSLKTGVATFYSAESELTVINEQGQQSTYVGGNSINTAFSGNLRLVLESIYHTSQVDGSILILVHGTEEVVGESSRQFVRTLILQALERSYFVKADIIRFFNFKRLVNTARELSEAAEQKRLEAERLDAEAKEAERRAALLLSAPSAIPVVTPAPVVAPAPEVKVPKAPEVPTVAPVSSPVRPNAAASRVNPVPTSRPEPLTPVPASSEPVPPVPSSTSSSPSPSPASSPAPTPAASAAATAPSAPASSGPKRHARHANVNTTANEGAKADAAPVPTPAPAAPSKPASWAAKLKQSSASTTTDSTTPAPTTTTTTTTTPANAGGVTKPAPANANGAQRGRNQRGPRNDKAEAKEGAPSTPQANGRAPRPAQEFLPKTIYVSGLPANTSGDDVKNFFSQFGSVTKVELGHRGVAYVEFVEESSAKEALSTTHSISGSEIRVLQALNKSRPQRQHQQQPQQQQGQRDGQQQQQQQPQQQQPQQQQGQQGQQQRGQNRHQQQQRDGQQQGQQQQRGGRDNRGPRHQGNQANRKQEGNNAGAQATTPVN